MAFNVNKLQSQMVVLEQRLSTLTSTQHAAPAVLPDSNVPKGPALSVVIEPPRELHHPGLLLRHKKVRSGSLLKQELSSASLK